MKQHVVSILLRAHSPISHIAETFGNSAVAQTRKIRQWDGTFAQVPEITGATIRHKLRAAASMAELFAIGFGDEGSEGRLSEAGLRLLFNGGMVTGRGDAGNIRLDQYRELVENVPHMALLGGCADNRTIPGKIQVQPATLLCREARTDFEQSEHRWMLSSDRRVDPTDPTSPTVGAVVETALGQTCRASLEEFQRVRMDSTLDPKMRALMSPAAAEGTEKRLLAGADAARAGDDVGRESAKSTMMPRRFEAISQGALLYTGFVAVTHSEIEEDALKVMVLQALARIGPGGDDWLGGMGREHFGKVVAIDGRWHEPRPTADAATPSTDLSMLTDPALGERFRAHLKDRREKVVDYLRRVNA